MTTAIVTLSLITFITLRYCPPAIVRLNLKNSAEFLKATSIFWFVVSLLFFGLYFYVLYENQKFVSPVTNLSTMASRHEFQIAFLFLVCAFLARLLSLAISHCIKVQTRSLTFLQGIGLVVLTVICANIFIKTHFLSYLNLDRYFPNNIFQNAKGPEKDGPHFYTGKDTAILFDGDDATFLKEDKNVVLSLPAFSGINNRSRIRWIYIGFARHGSVDWNDQITLEVNGTPLPVSRSIFSNLLATTIPEGTYINEIRIQQHGLLESDISEIYLVGSNVYKIACGYLIAWFLFTGLFRKASFYEEKSCLPAGDSPLNQHLERFYLVVIGLLILKVMIFNSSGLLLGNDDHFSIFAKEQLKLIQSVYSETVGGSFVGPFPTQIAQTFSVLLNATFRGLGLSFLSIQHLELGLQLVVFFYGIYFLGSRLFGTPHAGIFSVICIFHPQAYFNAINSHFIFWGWAATGLVAFAALQVISQSRHVELFRTSEDSPISRRSLRKAFPGILFAALATLPMGPGFFNPPIGISGALFILLVALVALARSENMRRALTHFSVFVVLAILVNLYWIWPTQDTMAVASSNWQNIYDNIGWSRTVNVNSMPLLETLMRNGTGLSRGGLGYSATSFTYFETVAFSLLPLLLISAIVIWARHATLIIFGLGFLFFTFLAKGPGAPFGFLYLDAMESFPLLQIFRSSYNKWGLAQSYCFAIFMGGGAALAIQRLDRLSVRSAVIAVLFTGLILVNRNDQHGSFLLLAIPIAIGYLWEPLMKIWRANLQGISEFRIWGPALLTSIGAFVLAFYINPYADNIIKGGQDSSIPKGYLALSETFSSEKNPTLYKQYIYPWNSTTIDKPDLHVGGSFGILVQLFPVAISQSNIRNNEFDRFVKHPTPVSLFALKDEFNKSSVRYILLGHEINSKLSKNTPKIKMLLSKDPSFEVILDNERVTLFRFADALPIVFYTKNELLEIRQQPVSTPFDQVDRFNYQYTPEEDGYAFMIRNYDPLWILTADDGSQTIPDKQIIIGMDHLPIMRWQVKKGLTYTIDYKQNRIARKARWISVSTISLILLTLFWIWLQKRKVKNTGFPSPTNTIGPSPPPR